MAADAASWELQVDRPSVAAVFTDIPPGDYVIVVKAPAFQDAGTRVSGDPGTLKALDAARPTAAREPAPSTLTEAGRHRRADRIFERDVLETFPGADPVVAVVE